MSSDATEGDLGPRPDARIEPGEPMPGGADAQPASEETVVADLPVDLNPAVDDSLTDSLSEREDTSTRATRDEDPGGDGGPEADGDAADDASADETPA